MLTSVDLSCLIVDDNAQYLEAATDLLRREGITVLGVASTIAEALQKAGELQPDVSLVDIDLGDESGFDLAERLAAVPSSKPARVILISTYSEMDFADLITASAAIGFISKSELSARTLYDALEQHPDGERGLPT
jgi:DNA-binding NarL/FixJ family response regulator